MSRAPTRLFLLLPLLALALLCGAPATAQDAAAPALVPAGESAGEAAARLRRKWELEGIETALRSGFTGVADTLVSRLLAQPGLPADLTRRLLNRQLQIALMRGQAERAASVRAQLLELGLTVDPLLEAFLFFFQGDPAQARAAMAAIDRAALEPADAAWLLVLDALLLARDGALEQSDEAFRAAEAAAPSELIRSQFEILRFREQLAAGASDAATVGALRESVRSMRGERGGFEAARLLAIALHRTGDQAGAVEVLNNQLALPALREFGLRPDFLLLLGSISGPESARGRLALREVVSGAGTPAQQAVALTLLAQAAMSQDDRDALLQDFTAWLAQQPPHPLSDRLLAYQAYFLAQKGLFELAGLSARQLLDRFPASPYGTTALRLLAYTSWNQQPPRYRTAADYLNQLRQRLTDRTEALEAAILVADSYYLNGDFANAIDAYASALQDAPASHAKDIFFQLILSEINADRSSAAAALIDGSRADPRLGAEVLWRADWNLLDQWRRTGRTAEAFQRINNVLAQGTGAITPPLAVRFRWLEARLTLEAGDPALAATRAATLLDEIAAGAFAMLPADQLDEVRSHLLLLRGEAEISSGRRADGLATFGILRETHPDSGPAILSYLVESRSESAGDNLVSAQQSLVALVDRFPASEYAPIALWEAAINAEQRGLNVHLQEAITILERLVVSYPTHELVYFARLKQADLARRLNDFPTALLLYERLLALFPNHPERFRAEMSRADCLMALGTDNPDRFDQAAIVYERNCLLPAAPLPIRLEAGFKWAHALRQQADLRGAEAVYWLLYERFVLDPDMSQALVRAEAGRYWMARVLFELASLQAEKGETAAAAGIYETHLQMNLPGTALARSRLDSLPSSQ